jgi:hypothetical protein
MKSLFPLLAAACGGEPMPPDVRPPDPPPAVGTPTPLPDYGAVLPLSEQTAGSIARLFTESNTPTTEGMRTPPPKAFLRMGPLVETIGEGWATHDGDRAVLVTQEPGGYGLTLIDVERRAQASLPFEGYPDGDWWSPRWSRSGRYLALGSLAGDVLDVTIFDARTGVSRQIATCASGFTWSGVEDLGVISYWPSQHCPLAEPQFHFFRPDLDRTWIPLAPTADAGWVFTGFTAQGEVLYREHRLTTVDGKPTWNPVGERANRLQPRPPPDPAAVPPATRPSGTPEPVLPA